MSILIRKILQERFIDEGFPRHLDYNVGRDLPGVKKNFTGKKVAKGEHKGLTIHSASYNKETGGYDHRTSKGIVPPEDLKELHDDAQQLKSLVELSEADKDGTISSDEAQREKELMDKIHLHIQSWKDEAHSIGGPFRSAGIMDRVKKATAKHLSK